MPKNMTYLLIAAIIIVAALLIYDRTRAEGFHLGTDRATYCDSFNDAYWKYYCTGARYV